MTIDYRPTFGFKIATKLPEEALDAVKETINIIFVLKPEKIKHEILGKIFHDLIPFEVRKAVAAFYTNNEAADFLAKLAITKATDTVADFACGSGTLLVSAYHRKKKLLEENGQKFTPQDHIQFLEKDLTGIDIMPFAAHLAAVHLSLQAPLYETQRVRLAVWDSTEPTVRPGKVIPALSRELRKAYANPKLDVFTDESARSQFRESAYIKKGSVTAEGVGGDAIPLEKVDVVIMNPPFTRQERLPDEYKKNLTNRFKRYSDVLTGQMGLHGYFLLLADLFLKEGGRLAFVLPATVLRLQSMEGIRKFLATNYKIEYIVTTDQRSAFSEAARFREILIIATKTKKSYSSSKCLFVNLKRIPVDAADSDFFADEVVSSKATNQELNDSDLSTIFVSQNELKKTTTNWFGKIATQTPESFLDIFSEQAAQKLSVLKTYLEHRKGKIVRGIEHWTGRPVSVSSSFILSSERHALKRDDRWILQEIREDVIIVRDKLVDIEIVVPKKVLTPALRRPSGLQSIDVSDEVDYAVISRFTGDNQFFIKSLVKKGENISTFVKKWRNYLESRKTNLTVSRRFDLSAPSTVAMAFYSEEFVSPCKMLWAIQDLKPVEAKILALWFNSTFNICQILARRAETRGAFMGLDQYILQQFLVLNPTTLTKLQKNQLVKFFDMNAKTKLPSIISQLKTTSPFRKALDLAILEALEIKGNYNKILDSTYSTAAQQITTLASLMKEGRAH